MNCNIWKLNDLVELSRHENTEVRNWACNRTATFYGQEGTGIIEPMLKDPDEDVVFEALHYLQDYPDSRCNDQLLELYKRQKSFIAGMTAFQLARQNELRWIPIFAERRLQSDFSKPEAIHSLNALGESSDLAAREILEKILSETDENSDVFVLGALIKSLLKHDNGLKTVLEYYSIFFKHHSAPVLMAIFHLCGFPLSLDELQEQLKKKKSPYIAKAVTFLKAKKESDAAETFLQFFDKKLYASAVEWLVDTAVKSFVARTGETAKDFDHNDSSAGKCLKVLTAFKDYLEWGAEKTHKDIAIAALIIYSKFIALGSLVGLNIALAKDSFLLAALLEERDDDLIDDQIIDALHSRGASPLILQKAVKQIKKYPESFGSARAVKLLGKLKNTATIPTLVELLDIECSGVIIDNCIFSLIQMGNHLVEYMIFNFSELSKKQKTRLLQVLSDIPIEETAELLLHHWEEFWRCDKRLFLEALEGVGAQQFIAPLRRELKVKELREERTYYLLCKIHAEEDEILDEIAERLQQQTQKLKKLEGLFSGGGLRPLLKDTLKVEIKCRKCEKAYTYKVEEVLLDDERPMIKDKIVCKNCRAINQYDLTKMGQLTLMAYLSLMNKADELGDSDSEEFSVKFGNTALMDGQKMSVSEICSYYEKEAKKFPNNPGIRVGYGNVLMRSGKELEAVFQYRQALKLDSMAVEAYLSLGEYESDKDNREKAYEYFKQAFKCMHVGNYYRSTDPEALRQAILSRIHAFEGPPFANMKNSSGIAMPSRDNAVGRNEQCPCGSGKKYKKCCMN